MREAKRNLLIIGVGALISWISFVWLHKLATIERGYEALGGEALVPAAVMLFMLMILENLAKKERPRKVNQMNLSKLYNNERRKSSESLRD